MGEVIKEFVFEAPHRPVFIPLELPLDSPVRSF